MVDFTNASCFPLEINSTTVRYERISWTLAASERQEVYVPILAKYELHNITAHCMIVMSHIDAQVTTPAEPYLSYRTVLPCTLSIPMLATWDNIVAETHWERYSITSRDSIPMFVCSSELTRPMMIVASL
jgi:hypothetical protein